MSKLKTLISTIRRENKIPADEIIDSLVDTVIDCGDECCKEAFIRVYEKSYDHQLTKELATEWVKGFKVTDGSGREHGEKWTIEQTTDVGNRAGINWSDMTKVDWYVVMNMEYSRHFDTAKTYGNETDPMWFAHIAKDEWCVKDKSLFEYYVEYVL